MDNFMVNFYAEIHSMNRLKSLKYIYLVIKRRLFIIDHNLINSNKLLYNQIIIVLIFYKKE